jgi:hypothetical protein
LSSAILNSAKEDVREAGPSFELRTAFFMPEKRLAFALRFGYISGPERTAKTVASAKGVPEGISVLHGA